MGNTITYRHWQPGDDDAVLELFLQDEQLVSAETTIKGSLAVRGLNQKAFVWHWLAKELLGMYLAHRLTYLLRGGVRISGW